MQPDVAELTSVEPDSDAPIRAVGRPCLIDRCARSAPVTILAAATTGIISAAAIDALR
jgi:hypothetical protein